MYSSGNEYLNVQRSLDFLSPPNSNPASPREHGDETLIGVGLLFIIHANTGKVCVHSIVPDSPAARCGCIQNGDVLVSIDARPVTSNTSLTELRSRILGPCLSTVTLGFCRNMVEDERISHSSHRFSVFLTREGSKSSSINRNKDTLFSELALASKLSEFEAPESIEAITEFQPKPPPARSLNALLVNGSVSSTSPKQRFSTAAKKTLHDNAHGDTPGVPARQSPSADHLYNTVSSPLQRIMKTISQSPEQPPSAFFSDQSTHMTDLNSKDSHSVNAVDLFSIQRLKMEVQAMEFWLQEKEAVTDDAEMLEGAREVFYSKKKELGDRLADFSQFADHVYGQSPDGDQKVAASTHFGISNPKSKSGENTRPRSDQNTAKGGVSNHHQTLATSVSPIQGFSRRPLSESELEFLSYEKRDIFGAELRISSAISNSKRQSQVASVEDSSNSVSTGMTSLEGDKMFSSRGHSMNASTSPSKVGKSVQIDPERNNVLGPSNYSSSNASASYSYIVSLASSVQVLDESLNDERKLLLISQHQHHTSIAKIAELERTVEHLQAQFERSETVNQRIMQRANALESTLHSWNFQKMTQDSELHSTHQLIAELNQQNIRLSNDLHGAFEQRFVQSAESPALSIQEISKQIVEATMLLKDIPALEYLWRRAHGQASALLLDIHEFSSAQEKHSVGDSVLL